MIQAQEALLEALVCAVSEVAAGHDTSQLAFETPKQAAHGDLAVTIAMQLARVQKKNPRELATQLVQALQRQPAVAQHVEALEIAGPGFVNLRLKAATKQAVIAEVLDRGDAFGRASPNGQRVMVEFVSANPTGPLHVGHARQGALGDSLCNLFESQGCQVQREFYYNDAGVQIATLANSVKARLDGLEPGMTGWPEQAYNGDYIADIAADFRYGASVRADDRAVTASGDAAKLDDIRDFAVAYLRHEQDLDLRAFGVRFDSYFLESSLYTSGRVEHIVRRIVEAGKSYEADGALWLKSTDFGDDKDRVMRKSDGSYTYFVPDVAYHVAKFERGFTRCINCQGTDHHGTIARVRAGLQAQGLGIPAGFPDYVLNTMVRVERGGREVKISKRAGDYVTLRDLIEWTSKDAVRFFLISRKADTEFTFDVDLAVKRNDENPVFYVQYAHARVCSVQEQFAQRQGGTSPDPRKADFTRLTAPTETALMGKLAAFPNVLRAAAHDLAPHDVAFYARELAAGLHAYYAAERFLVDDVALAQARLALLAATRQVLKNALTVIGVDAPTALHREDTPEPA
jgi:arginyl-tRNA synthetase